MWTHTMQLSISQTSQCTFIVFRYKILWSIILQGYRATNYLSFATSVINVTTITMSWTNWQRVTWISTYNNSTTHKSYNFGWYDIQPTKMKSHAFWLEYLWMIQVPKYTFNSKSHVCVDASISKATCTFHKWWGPHIPDIDYKAFKCSIFLQESTTETWTSITVNKHIEGLGYDKC